MKLMRRTNLEDGIEIYRLVLGDSVPFMRHLKFIVLLDG